MFIIRTKHKIKSSLSSSRKTHQYVNGFTLLEILIALFIFTILAMISTSALHTVINAQAGTEKNAARLRELQTALLIMSREIKQTTDRPIINSIGKEEVAFKGTARGFNFTHLGFENPIVAIAKSSLERSGYFWDKGKLWRQVWPALDQAPKARASSRALLHNVTNARFEYLDGEGRFHQQWPIGTDPTRTLPRAVKVELEIAQWGKLSQIYVIFADPIKTQAAISSQQGAQQSPTPKSEDSQANTDEQEQSADDKQSSTEDGDEQSTDDKQQPLQADGDEQSTDDKQLPSEAGDDQQSSDDKQSFDHEKPPATDSEQPSDDEEPPP